MAKYMTKKAAKEFLDNEKAAPQTAYFDGELSASDMKDMLRNRMNFGVAETNVILAALVLAGAKFRID